MPLGWMSYCVAFVEESRKPPRTMNLPTNSSVDTEDLSNLVQELRELGFDEIRFASYRTAAKLRYIQKKSNFLMVDLWNVIEGFRENGLNGLDPYSIITVPKLESVITSLYVNLNKRLPLNQQVDVLGCSRYLLSWLLMAYDNEGSGRVRIFSVKCSLITLCNGKLVDKLRYVFSLISDANGCLVLSRFSEFLQEILALPAMVLESSAFGYTEALASTIFDGTSKISVNGFLDALLSDPGPPCLMWLPLMHSMATVEDVSHGVQCNICQIKNIQGFRYKCQKCSNFNMCQNCFWQGKTVDSHRVDHEVKEYTTNKTGGKGLRSSFRKSLRCVPEKSKTVVPRYPEEPEKCLNLSHIVPPSPLPMHNGFPGYDPLDAYSDQQKMFALDFGQGPSRLSNNNYADSVSESDEEHRLIARYTARLASDGKYPPAPLYHPVQHNRTLSQFSMGALDTTQTQRDMIAQLESRNREILKEIARLRAQQEADYLNGESVNPVVLDELNALREHKLDLEDKLNGLQDSRRHLMGQLEGLMRLLKIQQLSPGDTPESSPRSGKTPPMPIYGQTGSLHRSAPVTPLHSESSRGCFPNDIMSTSAEFQTVDHNGGSNNLANRSLRNDLLSAADSLTNAMSSLVKELHSEEDRKEAHMNKLYDYNTSEDYKGSGHWTREMDSKYYEEEDAKLLVEMRGKPMPSNYFGSTGRGGRYVGPHAPSSSNSVSKCNGYKLTNGGNVRGGQPESPDGMTSLAYSDAYNYRTESLGRRRSLGQEPRLNGNFANDKSSPSDKPEDDICGADWEDGLRRRVSNNLDLKKC